MPTAKCSVVVQLYFEVKFGVFWLQSKQNERPERSRSSERCCQTGGGNRSVDALQMIAKLCGRLPVCAAYLPSALRLARRSQALPVHVTGKTLRSNFTTRAPALRVTAVADMAAPAPLADEGAVTNPILQVRSGILALVEVRHSTHGKRCFLTD